MNGTDRHRVTAWVGSEIIPHEADVRAWLCRTLNPDDLEDIIQETYAQIAGLETVSHIRNPRAYFFTAARTFALMRLRRARVVNIEMVTEIDALSILEEEPSPERIVAGRRELARVRRLIEGLPERWRRVVELRKIEGLSQREAAEAIGVPEHTIDNDLRKGLKAILKAIAEGDRIAERKLDRLDRDERARNTPSDT